MLVRSEGIKIKTTGSEEAQNSIRISSFYHQSLSVQPAATFQRYRSKVILDNSTDFNL